MRIALRLVLCAASFATANACGAPTVPASGVPALEMPNGFAACSDAADHEERLVIDWPPLERSRLESAARRGLVMLHVTGCTARIVDSCRSRQRYEYSPTSRQREVTTMRDADEVRAKLPFGAIRFGANIERAASLAVTMTVVGRYELPATERGASEQEGACEDVTHVVSSVSVGSFEISTTRASNVLGGAEALLAEAHAQTSTERRHLDSAGVEARCQDAKRTDTSPPEDCGIPLRVELRRFVGSARTMHGAPTPVGAGEPREPVMPSSPKDTARVMALAKTEILPCYRQALAQSGKVVGDLTLVVSVGQAGNVRSVSTKYDVPDSLAACASTRIERVPFPTSDDARTRVFVVPLVFRGS